MPAGRGSTSCLRGSRLREIRGRVFEKRKGSERAAGRRQVEDGFSQGRYRGQEMESPRLQAFRLSHGGDSTFPRYDSLCIVIQ